MFAKIMTFNLRQNTITDGKNAWPYRVKAVADVIKNHDADIIGIQEGLHDMLIDLEPLLPEYAWIGEGREGGEKGEYTAVFYKKSKWNLNRVGHFSLSETPEKLGEKSWESACPRMCTWAILQSYTGEKIAVFNTHLDHRSEEAQQKGMRLIQERMLEMKNETGLPVVLTGDFNVYPENMVIHNLEAAGYVNVYTIKHEKQTEIGTTVHHFLGGEAGKPIDYIFVSPDVQIQDVIVDYNQYEGRYPSDHYPVVAELVLN